MYRTFHIARTSLSTFSMANKSLHHVFPHLPLSHSLAHFILWRSEIAYYFSVKKKEKKGKTVQLAGYRLATTP